MKLWTLVVILAAATMFPASRALAMPGPGAPSTQNPAAASPAQASMPSQSSPAATPSRSAAPPVDQQPGPGQSANAPAPAAPPAGERGPTWAPLQYVDVWNKGTFDPLWFHNEVLARITLFDSHGHLTPFDLRKFQQVLTAWHESAPDIHFDVKDTIVSADGNKVVLRLLVRGTFVKPLFGPMFGNQPHPVTVSQTLTFELRDGKISHIWQEDDDSRLHMMMGQHWCINGPGNTATEPPPAAAPVPAPPSQPAVPSPAPPPAAAPPPR